MQSDLDSSSLSTSTSDQSLADYFSRIAIVRTNVCQQDFATKEAFIAEQEVINRAEQVKQAIEQLNIAVKIFPADQQLVENLQQFQPQLCFNFVDTVKGQGGLAAGIPGIFDLLSIPYVGAGTLSLSLNTNKFLTKTLFDAWGVPTPKYQIVRTPGQKIENYFRYPLIAKLNEEHGSIAIHDDSVVINEKELRQRIKWLLETYHQPVLIEEFIENATEITGLVLEGRNTNLYLAQREFDKPAENRFKLLSFETKWATDLGMEEPVEYITPTQLDKNTINSIKKDMKLAFNILRMDDYGRFDIMIDQYQNYYFIDANANPSFGPESSAVRAATVSGANFEQILRHLLLRNQLDLVENDKLIDND